MKQLEEENNTSKPNLSRTNGSQKAKNIVITGANSGVGFINAKVLY